MRHQSKTPTFGFYVLITLRLLSVVVLITLGLLSVVVLGMWLQCIASLHEAMRTSRSPMVGGAPFLNVAFIFVFAWLSYAFFGAAVAHIRESAGRRPVRWGKAAFWFAITISALAALYHMLQPEPVPQYVGYLTLQTQRR